VKAYVGVELQLHTLLSLALDDNVSWTSCYTCGVYLQVSCVVYTNSNPL